MTVIDENGGETADRSGGGRPPGAFSVALSCLRRDPWLFVPFFLAGAVLSLVDWLRRRDPIPAFERAGLETNGISVQVEFVGYPTGVSQTMVSLESLIGLELPVLAQGLGVLALAVLAISVAGVLTIARAMETDVSLESGIRFVGFVVGMDLFFRVLGSIDLVRGMGLFGLVPLVLIVALLVRLFVVPGLLVAGRSLWPAVRESYRLTRGRGWTISGLILLFGLGAWILAHVPFGGTILSSAVVAPVHAVVIVTVLERSRADR